MAHAFMKLIPAHSPIRTAGFNLQPLLLLGAGLVAGGLVVWLLLPPREPGKPASPTDPLSPASRAVLAHLPAPVTIKFYSLLPAGADAALPDFANRVSQLLAAMQADSSGKLTVTAVTDANAKNADAATADGLQVFNLEKGAASYLGLTLASGSHHETVARLQPEFEAALEYDLDRILQRVAVPEAPAPMAPEVARPDPEITTSVHRLIPDISGTPPATADQIFHAEFMSEISTASAATEAEMTAAQQQVTQAEAGGSAPALTAARENLARVQAAQGEKIRAIAARLKTRMAVFQQLKNAATNNTP